MSEEPLAPQNFLYGCVLEGGKEVVFNPDDDGFEHQLDLRMACVDPATKDELHMVEVEGTDTEGQTVKAALVSLKPSTLPSVCLGGFTITPPAVFRLKAGSGPIHISGQHLVMMENDDTFDEEDDDEEEQEEIVATGGAKKRLASSPAAKSQKKMKMEVVEEDEDDDDEDEDDDDDDEEDEESEAEESPVKAKPAPTKQKTPAKKQNGKSSAPSTPASKEKQKTPNAKAEKSPKTPLTIPEVKSKVMESVNKGVQLPKVQAKFENFIKNCHRLANPQDIAELWKWRQTLKDAK